MLEQNTTKKEQVDDNIAKLEVASNSKGYKIEVIWDSAV